MYFRENTKRKTLRLHQIVIIFGFHLNHDFVFITKINELLAKIYKLTRELFQT